MSAHKDNRARSRREQFVNPAARKGRIPLAPFVTLGVIVLAAVVYRVGFYEEAQPAATAAPVAHSTAGAPPLLRASGAVAVDRPDVVIPAAQFDDGQARFFTYDTSNGETVRFFVMKSGDGVIRAAFDACDVCYREKRGYRQQGDHMLCINCGQTFESTQINVRQGGCNPAPLDRALLDGQVVLKAADLEQGAFYF
jgi:uncharacterized membrane protein